MTAPAESPAEATRRPAAPGVILATSLEPSLNGPCRTAAALAIINKVSRSPHQAICVLHRTTDRLITDQHMPCAQMDDLIRHLHSEHPDTYRYRTQGSSQRFNSRFEKYTHVGE